MANSGFWRDVAEKFRAIPDPDGLLGADWTHTATSGLPFKWSLRSIRVVGGTQTVRVRFEALARHSASQIPPTTGRRDLIDAWLDALNKEIPTDDFTREQQDDAIVLKGRINRICERSADYCNILESRALEIESASPPITPPAEKKPLEELRELGLIVEIDENTATRMWSALLIIGGRLLQGHYRAPEGGGYIRGHFTDAYHAVAAEIVIASTPDEVIEFEIPAVIQAFGVKQKWVPRLSIETLTSWVLRGAILEWKGKRLALKNPPLAQNDQPAQQQAPLSETIGEQIKRLREECRWTIEELAEITDVHERTVSRHELGEVAPYGRTLSAYERTFSKRLQRKVVINKMP
jgi:DNA-binding XRE family transcriptional regulator